MRCSAIMLIVMLLSCKVNKVSQTDGPVTIGDGNFVYYAPNNSKNYNKQEINKAIDLHQTTIQIIKKRINYYNYLRSTLDKKYSSGTVPKRKYEKQKDDIDQRLNDLKYEKSEADQAFELWKQLLDDNVKQESEYNKKMNDLREKEREFEASKRVEEMRITSAWNDIKNARRQLEMDIVEFEEASKYKPTNCNTVTFSGVGYLAFRNRPLTTDEINVLNSCTSWNTGDGGTKYEDLSRTDCQMKKRINEQTNIGYFENGDIVDYLGRQGNWNEVVDINTGQKGFISARYGSRPTLTEISCD